MGFGLDKRYLAALVANRCPLFSAKAAMLGPLAKIFVDRGNGPTKGVRTARPAYAANLVQDVPAIQRIARWHQIQGLPP